MHKVYNLLILSEKQYSLLKFFCCLGPVLFALSVILTGNVNFEGMFETAKYTIFSKYWLGYTQEIGTPSRLPAYPLFVAVIYFFFGIDNFNALLVAQAILGFFSIFMLIKTLENLGLSKNIIVLSTIFLNFSILFRFSVFLPNCLFISILIFAIFFLTKFFKEKTNKSFIFFCIFFFFLILTRPLLQLSIFITIPLIIYFLCKTNNSKLVKSSLILAILSSYFLGISVQFLRFYNYDKSTIYTAQSGEHFLFWVIPCLSKKYACGSRDLLVLKELRNKFNQVTENKEELNLEKINKIKFKLGFEYIFNEMNKDILLWSIFFSYAKLLFHSSLIEIYSSFNLDVKELYNPIVNGPSEKIKDIASSMFKNPLIFLWIIAVLIIVLLRFLQLYGIFVSIKDKPLKGYYLILISILLLILISGVGLGNPRYRSDCEPILIIFGAIAINKIFFPKNKIKKKNE